MAKQKPQTGAKYIQRVYRQHSSVVMTIPRLVCEHLGLKAGDYTIFTCGVHEGAALFEKFVPGGSQNGRDNSDSGNSDSRG